MSPRLSQLPRRGSGSRVLLELELTRGLLETQPASGLQRMRSLHVPTLREVVDGLAKAAKDEAVAGLVAHVGHGEPTLAQAAELRAAVRAFAASGKPTVCWAESFGEVGPGNIGFHIATAFDEVWIQPSGDLGLVGLNAEVVFVREALDKLGIEPQIAQRHEYKTAANTFLQSGMTEPHREMMTRLVESATGTVLAAVAADRSLSPEQVRDAVDAAPLSATDAQGRGLVDRIGYRDEVYADLRRRLGQVEPHYVERYGKGVGALAAKSAALTRRTRPVVAVVQASGPIHLGRSSGSSLGGRSVGSDSLGTALRAAGSDDSVAAVVLRVDSPGGSYVASDAIRREVLALRSDGTPVVASMANVAASGGYYIAMPADRVLASPGTLTGSIGVLAGKQVLRDALDRVGISRESVSGGRYADMFSSQQPFDEDEWRRLEGWLDRVYADFTGKAAEDRRMDPERLRSLARGRVWTGADAHEHGLVDALGGLSDAVDAACRLAGVRREAVDVRAVPRLSLVDRLRPAENSEHPAAEMLLGEGMPLLDRALGLIDLPSHGVLRMPFGIRLR